MSLFQIAEPGQSTVKEACKGRAVGIDLGTTNSLIAYVKDGEPTIIPGPDGRELIPSVVHYSDDGSVTVGAEAKNLASRYPRDTIASVKRFVGRGPEDGEATRTMTPYQFAESDGRVVKFAVAGGRRAVTPIEVSAEILRTLKVRAETVLRDDSAGPEPSEFANGVDGGIDSTIDGAVITVPAYFDDAQRQATRDAGRLAGLQVLRLLAEPTAAALAYGLDKGTKGTYAVYDLGGGTFDISILDLVEGVFRVKATGGDSALGGDDFDRTLAERILDEAGYSDGMAGPKHAGTRPDRALVSRALREARAVKERLSDSESTEYALELPDGRRFVRIVTRAELAEAIRPLLDKTGRACRRALKDAEIRAAELDGVILVGGSTRSPCVRDYVAEVFDREPLCDIDPEHVVALGAAVQAELLAGGSSEVTLLDVIPLSLGIETMGGVVEKIVHRNSTIPCGAMQEFTTYADNQTGFDIHVVQGEREAVDDNRSLARFYLKGIPPMVAGMARVEITFLVDADGILRVSALEKLTGIENSIEVKPSYGLTDEEIERMLMDSFEHADDDLVERNLRVERIEAERILNATRAAMKSDPELLDDVTRAATEKAMAELETLAAGEDYLVIRKAIEALDLASKPFAQRRMNRAVGAAVKGRSVGEVEREISH
ncbi:MAG: molecular chaperone HscA [Proteobacteria bacterium]|nr:molecular chaperone HscA [Pseudomonadota bacterium]